jgi:uroporphyrinogen-III decarboxylase
MNARDRLTALVGGRPVDRVPVFCNLLDQGPRELGIPPRQYFARGAYVAEGQLRLREKYGYDNLWALFYVGREAELLGCREILFADDGPPNVGEMVIRSPRDIETLKVPDDIAGHPAFEQPLECLRLLRAEAGGRYPICAYLTASATLPAILMGMERWIELLVCGPPALRDALLEKCSDFFHKEAAAYRAAGVDVLLYSNPFGSLDFVPQELFRRLSLPWIERDLEPVGTDGVVYYCGGARMNPVIPEVLHRTGIGAYYLGPQDDIADGKRALDGRAVCAGVINDIQMISWSPAEVRARVRSMFAQGMPGGKFFFGTVVMPAAIPEANIHAMVEAALEYGAPDGRG